MNEERPEYQPLEKRVNFQWSDAYHPSFRFGRAELSAARDIQFLPHQIPGTLLVRNPAWDAELLDIFWTLFDHFSEQKIVWEEIHLFLMSVYDEKSWEFIPKLLHRASSLSIFRKLRIEMRLLFGPQSPPNTNTEFLLDGIRLNKNLEAIELSWIQSTSYDPFRVIGEHQFQMSKGDWSVLNQLLEHTASLKELSLHGIGIGMEQSLRNGVNKQEDCDGEWRYPLCKGFSQNSSLERIDLDFVGCSMTDESVANLVQSLSQIPTLKSLALNLPIHAGVLASRAIQDLLVSEKCNSIADLELVGPVVSSSFKGDRKGAETDSGRNEEALQLDPNTILQGIRTNKSLRSLRLQRVQSEGWTLLGILEAVRHSKSIQRLEVEDAVPSSTFQGLQSLKRMKRFDRPILLILPVVDSYLKECGNSVDDLQAFLATHPEIRLQPPSNESNIRSKQGNLSTHASGALSQAFMQMFADSWVLSNSLKHQWDFNWYGRCLLFRDDVPLGLWPRVMERASMEPSILFEFVSSPVVATWICESRSA